MSKDKDIYQALSQRITLSLARQHEAMQQYNLIQDHNKLLENRVEQLMQEIKALSDENSDLKEIVYALNQENEGYRKQA